MDGFIFWTVVAIALCIAYVIYRNNTGGAPERAIPSHAAPLVELPRTARPEFYEHAASDEAIMAIAQDAYGGLGWFRSKIVGVTRTNEDGTSRQDLLIGLEIGATLHIFPEPDNPVDPNAFAVYTREGEQLGYLPKPLAEEMAGRYEQKERYLGVLLKRDFVGDGFKCGAIIGLLHLPRAKAREYGLLDDGTP